MAWLWLYPLRARCFYSFISVFSVICHQLVPFKSFKSFSKVKQPLCALISLRRKLSLFVYATVKNLWTGQFISGWSITLVTCNAYTTFRISTVYKTIVFEIDAFHPYFGIVKIKRIIDWIRNRKCDLISWNYIKISVTQWICYNYNYETIICCYVNVIRMGPRNIPQELEWIKWAQLVWLDSSPQKWKGCYLIS